MRTNSETVIGRRRSVEQSRKAGGTRIGRAPILPQTDSTSSPLINKQALARAETMASCLAPSVTDSKSLPICDRPIDHGTERQCFKFTSERGGYQTQSKSLPISSSLSSSLSLLRPASVSGLALSRSYTGRDLSLLANRGDNGSQPTPPLSAHQAMSPAAPAPLQSPQASPPRSLCEIIPTRTRREHEVSPPPRRDFGQSKGSPTLCPVRMPSASSFAVLVAVLIALGQLGQLFSPSAPIRLASAQALGPEPTTGALRGSVRNGISTRDVSESARELRDSRPVQDQLPVNMSNVIQILFKKRPYSKYWTVEQKWDDLFRRAIAVQDTMRQAMVKSFMRDIENYSDISLSPACEQDLKFVQGYVRQSTNFRWMAHMFDATGKSESGMLTGMLSNLGHVVQCIRVRAPSRPSNHTFEERFFDQQTELLGERFRGKYCLASIRPVLPTRPIDQVVSRFSELMNTSLLSNISYTGEPKESIKQRIRQMHVPSSVYSTIDRDHLRLDQIPFESELYQYLIAQRNFMYTLPRFMGVCFPSSCSRDDVRMSLQRTMNDQHQVVDMEFECEQEEMSVWDWFSTPRLVAYVMAGLILSMAALSSLARYILLSKMQINRSKLAPQSRMASLLNALDMFSVDKCAGILFVKTKPASPWVDWTKVENNRSTSIDALRGVLALILVYSQLLVLGCLPVPFMWAKWSDAMFPFYRSMSTQLMLNMSIWSEAFYMISAYVIALKVLENSRARTPVGDDGGLKNGARPARTSYQAPNFITFAVKRYVRLVLPMTAFILLNYIWPRLSNGFVMQDQAAKLMRPCDKYGWTNFLLFHNHNPMNETCLWPSHVSASFFQLHLLSYPILLLCLAALHSQFTLHHAQEGSKQSKRLVPKLLSWLVFGLLLVLALVGAIYPALQASSRSLIVPFLADYIDYDNYRRVIEWTVLPTHNHLTSYMFGIGVAFIVVRRRAGRELQSVQTSQWTFRGPEYRENSVDSIRSSSTQELHQQDGLTFKAPTGSPAVRSNFGEMGRKQFVISAGSSVSSEQRYEDDSSLTESSRSSSVTRSLKTVLCLTLCLGSLHSSWFWNGLSQPMSDQQTFWFMMLTKLVFCAAFAHLFLEHVATRRNSSNPWIVTRFFVPIGRMSLTVFYMSWLVIWFDLLSSLYQWHPSHYFVCEKYNEIIFITLILAMIIYAAFEGIVKRIQYSSRTGRLVHDVKLSAAADAAGSGAAVEPSRYRQKPFESFFHPDDKPTLLELKSELKLSESSGASATGRAGDKPQPVPALGFQGAKPAYLSSMGDVSTISSIGGNLSASDRYKLNAELRANYSFASIGLYESAGATGDLSHQQTSDPNDKRR